MRPEELVKKNPPKTIKQVLDEGYTPVIFARVSSRSQEENLPAQVEVLVEYVKSLGFKKKPLVFSIQ